MGPALSTTRASEHIGVRRLIHHRMEPVVALVTSGGICVDPAMARALGADEDMAYLLAVAVAQHGTFGAEPFALEWSPPIDKLTLGVIAARTRELLAACAAGGDVAALAVALGEQRAIHAEVLAMLERADADLEGARVLLRGHGGPT